MLVFLLGTAGVASGSDAGPGHSVWIDDPEHDTYGAIPVSMDGAGDLVGLRVTYVFPFLEIDAHIRDAKVGDAGGVQHRWDFELQFQLMDAKCSISLGLETLVTATSEGEVHFPTTELLGNIDSSGPCADGRAINGTLEVTSGLVRIRLPAAFLFQTWAETSGDVLAESNLRPGDIGGFQAFLAIKKADLVFLSFDRLDGHDQRLALPDAWPNAEVALRLRPGSAPYYLAPGRNHSVPVTIINRLSFSTINTLSWSLDGPAAALSDVRVTGPSSIRIPAGESRNYTFFIQRGDVGGAVRFEVHATPLGRTSVGADDLLLLPGERMGPDRSTFHFHAKRSMFRSELDVGLDPPRAPFIDCFLVCLGQGVMSTQETLEGYVNRGLAVSEFLFPGPVSPVPLFMRKDGMVEFDLALSLNRPASEIVVKAELLAGPSSKPVASWEETRDFEGSTQRFNFRARLKQDLFLPAQERFSVKIDVTPEFDFIHPEPRMDLAQSQLRLPLAPVPEELVEAHRPTPFQIQVHREKHEFVNPGEARLFRLEVLNMDAREQRLRLVARTPAEGWSVRLEPGSQFILPPASSVNLGLTLEAPADAAEGAFATVFVNATSDDNLVTGVRVSATVVQSIELEDDRGMFSAAPEDLALVEEPPAKEALGPQWTGGVVTTVGVVRLLQLRWRRLMVRHR